MLEELAVQFLGVATNPGVALVSLAALGLARRSSTVRLASAAAGAAFGALDTAGTTFVHGGATLAVSAIAGLLVAEIALHVVAPVALWTVSGAAAALTALRRRR